MTHHPSLSPSARRERGQRESWGGGGTVDSAYFPHQTRWHYSLLRPKHTWWMLQKSDDDASGEFYFVSDHFHLKSFYDAPLCCSATYSWSQHKRVVERVTVRFSEAVRETIGNARAPSTCYNYKQRWKLFSLWCHEKGGTILSPAHWQVTVTVGCR